MSEPRFRKKMWPMDDPKVVVIVVEDGCLQEVLNLPEGISYELIDLDNDRTCECSLEDQEIIEDARISWRPICRTCCGMVEVEDDQ